MFSEQFGDLKIVSYDGTPLFFYRTVDGVDEVMSRAEAATALDLFAQDAAEVPQASRARALADRLSA